MTKPFFSISCVFHKFQAWHHLRSVLHHPRSCADSGSPVFDCKQVVHCTFNSIPSAILKNLKSARVLVKSGDAAQRFIPKVFSIQCLHGARAQA